MLSGGVIFSRYTFLKKEICMTTPFRHPAATEDKFFMMGGRAYQRINKFPMYGINHTGRVVHSKTGELLKTSKSQAGHLIVKLHKDSAIHNKLLHQLIVEHFDPTWDPTVHYLHQDGNKNNNHILNLTHEPIPLDAEKGEFNRAIVGVCVGFKGKVYPNYRQASKHISLRHPLPNHLVRTYKSFVYKGVRFTSIFA